MGDLVLFDSLKIFSNKDFSLCYFFYKGEYYFKASNVAKGLGYKNGEHAVRVHVKEKYKYRFGSRFLPPMNRAGKKSGENRGGALSIYISLPGFCQFISQSKMKAAEPFQDWVFETVLPSLFKFGKYKLSREEELKTLLRDIERPKARKLALEFYDQTKDEEKSKRGKKGARAFWNNYYAKDKKIIELGKEVVELGKEVVELKDKLRQKTVDLECLQMLSRCLSP